MRVGEDAFTHGRGEEGDLSLGDKGGDGGGAGVGGAFADNDKWRAGGFDELGDFEEGGFVS